MSRPDSDALGGTVTPPSSPPSTPLNVLLISVDALRADMSWAGYARPVAPNLSRLVESSVVFEEHRANASFTAQSVPAMLAGRLASTLYRTGYFFAAYAPANRFFPELLREREVRTVGLHAHHYFRPGRKGLDQGFEVWEVLRGESARGWSLGPITADRMTDRLIEILSEPAHARRPFFAWAHYMDPHHEPGNQYTRHADAPDFGRKPRDVYDGEVWFTDRHVGRLLDWAEQQPWWSETAVLVTGDHGEAFGEHGMFQHAHELWEVLVRVPLIVRVPGARPRRIAAATTHLDLAPTVLGLMGREPPPEMMGRSLVAEIFGAPPRPPAAVLLEIACDTDQTGRRAIVKDGFKVVRFGPGAGWKHELYDLQQDPGELRDLSRDDPAQLESMVAALDTAFAAVPSVRPHGGMPLEDGTVANGPTGETVGNGVDTNPRLP
ncbi:MAG: sulfatase [Deltaproteobacteria bacterium]|nr:sulfatase [Deltaproteobacteria bacterium]MBW2533848.1 sulfatase [Deltaproteobacteria bacterium]